MCEKRDTRPETVLKQNKIKARVLLTENHVSTSLKCQIKPLDIVWNYYLWQIKMNLGSFQMMQLF